jgi:hypothetical protein
MRFRPLFTVLLLTLLGVVCVSLWAGQEDETAASVGPLGDNQQRVRYDEGKPDTVAIAAAAWMTEGQEQLVGDYWKDVDLVVLREPRENLALRLEDARRSILVRRGRIGVIRPTRVPTYHPELFGAGFRREALMAEPEDSPMWNRLGPRLRASLGGSGPLSDEVRVELAEQFKVLLDDRSLFSGLSTFYDARTSTASEIMSVIPVRWQPLAQWLQHNFDERGVFDPEGPELDALDVQALRRFNSICLSTWFFDEYSNVLGSLLPSAPERFEAAVTKARLRVSQTFPVAPGLEVVALELAVPSEG